MCVVSLHSCYYHAKGVKFWSWYTWSHLILFMFLGFFKRSELIFFWVHYSLVFVFPLFFYWVNSIFSFYLLKTPKKCSVLSINVVQLLISWLSLPKNWQLKKTGKSDFCSLLDKMTVFSITVPLQRWQLMYSSLLLLLGGDERNL